ncbi:hypothetical protein RND81_12G225200 [Saponaria officinalis]|uniref:Myotubularin phosphatase domain-containing protein n=1 Tax=Saponaria officinalis TaxID=3572 RepID=A0AAW1HE47_SAPOF
MRSSKTGPSRFSAYPSSDNLDAAVNWDDDLNWPYHQNFDQHHQPSVSYGNSRFLLEAEEVLREFNGVRLVNTDEAGTLLVSNYRLLFLSQTTVDIISLGTIPFGAVEKFNKLVVKQMSGSRNVDKSSGSSQRLLQVHGKDMRIIVFGFQARTKQRRAVFEALLRYTRPARLWDLYAFTCGPARYGGTNPKVRLLDEYIRILGVRSHFRAANSMIDEGSFTFSNDCWRISSVNSNYTFCATYPFALVVPKSISDEELVQASTFRARCRLPVISWCHPVTGAVLARSSQPLVGIMMNMRSNTDEKLVAALCTQLCGGKEERRKLYICDARPRKNALANGAMGGGSESSANYFQSEIVFFGIDNIHAMRDSLSRLRDYLDTYGTTSSDGKSSYLRHGGSSWGGGNLSSMSASVSTLGDSGWLSHVQNVLAGAAWIAARIAKESASVLVHCSDGWDRTTQLVSLASLLLDPYYRTFKGFQALVEKDWLAFGHPFADRFGLPTLSGSGNMPLELSRQPSASSLQSSPSRQQSGSFAPPSGSSQSQNTNHCSPIFMQWVDCVSQLLRMYPFAFEFSSAFLVDVMDCVLSCRFGNFLCNSEKERQQCNVSDMCGCLWSYLTELRKCNDRSHVHYNFFYDPRKHEGALLPPAAALAPTLWPHYLLRWACPREVEAGDLEAKCRGMFNKFSEFQKAKEAAERKTREVSAAMESLTVELRNEKQLSNSAVNLAKRASRENGAIKRAIQTLGCKIHFSSNGDTTIDVQNYRTVSPQTSVYLPSRREPEGSLQEDEKSDLSVSIAVMPEDSPSTDSVSRICESLCPLRSPDGHCRWPEAGCAQIGSQFVGVKANFDAFDRLSIDDGYF